MRTVFIVTSAALAALFAVAAAAPPAEAADPYNINAILPLTGGAAFLGKGEQQALQIAEKFVNKTGGIKGRPLEFVFHDDQTEPAGRRCSSPTEVIAAEAGGDPGLVARRGVQRHGAADEGRAGRVLLLAGHPSRRRQLRLHRQRLDRSISPRR